METSAILYDYALSPNGRYLALSVGSGLRVKDLFTGNYLELPDSQPWPAAWSVGGAQLLWRPDSKMVAVRLAARSQLNQPNMVRQREAVTGEDHVLLFPITGTARLVKLEHNYELGLWVDAYDLKKWEQGRGRK